MSTTIQRAPVILAGAVNENVIAGQPGEFISARNGAVVAIYAVRDTGGAAGVGTVEVLFGQRQVYPPAPLSNSIAAGRLNKLEDMLLADGALPNERITVRIVETGGAAALTVIVRVDIQDQPG